jgi:putative ABC transport system permease protein
MINDLINAFRQWRRTPVVTTVALASLAVGIGANVALFGVVDALLLKSLPIRDPQSLIRFVTEDPEHGDIDLSLSNRGWAYVRDRQPFADAVLAASSNRVNLSRGGEARHVPVVYINGSGLTTLGVDPSIGRTLQASDDTDTAEPVVMISYALWQRDYQGRADALGQTIWLTNQPFTIVGVVPRAFYGLEVGQHADVFVPLSGYLHIRLASGNNSPQRPDLPWLSLYARLKPGQTIAEATAALRAWVPELRDATRPAGPDADGYLAHPASAVPGGQGMSYLREQYQRPLFVLLGAVALVLVIACANLAALVLARFSDRRHELGVRLALGAGRARIMRMLVAESVLLAVAGGVLGVVFAQVLVGAMIPYLGSATGPRAELAVTVDARLLAFATAIALVSGTIAGLLPAWRASRVTPQLSIAAASRGMHGRRSTRALRWMVAGQVGLSLVLVAGASVMVRSFVGLTTAPKGVDADRVLIALVSGSLAGADTASRYQRIEEIRRQLRQTPGTASVSGGMITPLSSSMAAAQVEVPGSIYKPGSNDMRMNGRSFTPFNNVLPHYFATIGTPILMGRDFDDRDGPGTPPVAIVNQAFATRHYGDANPIGRTIVVNGQSLEIIGLAADAKLVSLKDRTPIAIGYGAYTQLKNTTPITSLRFALRVDNPDAVRPAVAAAIRGVDPRLSIEFRNMRDEASATINRERLLAWLAGIFAVLGLVMAIIGLYGTFTYAVTRRRSEIGVRMAVGADRGNILRMILREAGFVLVAGTILGVAGALATGQILQSLLISVSAKDPWMLAIAVVSVIGAAGIASLIPARRAALTDPMVALREE